MSSHLPWQDAQTFPAVQTESKLNIYVNQHLFMTDADSMHTPQNALCFFQVTISDYFC